MILGKNYLPTKRYFQRFPHYKQVRRNSYGNHFLMALTTFKHRLMLKNQHHHTNSINIDPLLDD